MIKYLERRLFTRNIAIGILLTAMVVSADAPGLLKSLDYWLYDQRAAHCQLVAPPPTTRLVHLDIDDASLDALGRWPWPRSMLARILGEVQRAGPAAISLDILLSEPQKPQLVQDSLGHLQTIDDDQELARVMHRSGKVVLAASFKLEPNEVQSPRMARATDWFMDDLELPQSNFDERAKQAGWQLEPAEENDLLIHARRLAMRARIDQELDRGAANVESLFPRLLPHTDAGIHSSLSRLLRDEYTVSRAAHAIYRFGAPMTSLALPPVQGVLQVIPTQLFSDNAASCAFANYDIFDNATVRSVPLLVEYKGRLYPQFGLASACMILGADPSKIRVEGSDVIIPVPGKPIRIPTFTYHSKSLDRDVPLIVAIPWFGKSDWETMYDWSAHRTPAAHLSIVNVWDICFKEDEIARNSASIDLAISQILSNDREDKLGLDPDAARKYAAALPAIQDTSAREKMAQTTLNILNDAHWLEAFTRIPANEITLLDRFQNEKLLDAIKVLHDAVGESHRLRQEVDSSRLILDRQIRDKGILVGFTATGFEDQVSTSLHLHCPGVVVHGVIASAVLTGHWWHMAPGWIALALTMIFGLWVADAEARYSPLLASLLGLGLLLSYALINALIVFGCFGWIVGLAGPMIVILVVWGGCTLDRLLIERVQRARMATEMAAVSREMDLAQKVQMALIPTSAPKLRGLEAAGWTLAASVTGGDCYDLWQLPDGRLGILLADASGHGLAPAMIVSQVRTLVRTLSESETHPQALLNRVNNRLAGDLEPTRFVTCFLGFMSIGGTLHWASAGQGPVYWLCNNDGKVMELASTGLPLGIQTDCFLEDPLPPVELGTCGSLILFSDGMFEAPSPAGDQFGIERCQTLITKTCGQPSASVIEALRSAVQTWQGKITPADDQTIVVVRRIVQ